MALSKDDLKVVLNVLSMSRATVDFLEKFNFENADEERLAQKQLFRKVLNEIKELEAEEAKEQKKAE